jgi:hypothetical protein
MRTFFFTLGILWGIFLAWFILVYLLQNLFNLSDKTATYLINIGGVILSVAGFIVGFKYGGK